VFVYPVTLKRDKEGGFVATLKDIPEAVTQGETKVEALARRLHTTPQEVNRIIHHTTRIDSIADALKVLGKRLDLRAG
jgi:hypothetical protein